SLILDFCLSASGSQGGMNGVKTALDCDEASIGFSQIKGQTVNFIRKDLSLADGLKSILFIGSFIRCRAWVRARSTGVGLAVAEGVFALQTQRNQERHLRMWA